MRFSGIDDQTSGYCQGKLCALWRWFWGIVKARRVRTRTISLHFQSNKRLPIENRFQNFNDNFHDDIKWHDPSLLLVIASISCIEATIIQGYRQ
jgi:hypothetical protein